MRHKIVKNLSVINAIAILVAIVAPFFVMQDVKAANMAQTVVRLDRLAAGATAGTVCAEPSTALTEAFVEVTFPTAFTVNPTAGNWDVTTTDLPLGATIWPGVGTEASAVNSKTVTFTSTELTVGTLYCFNFVGTSTLTTVAGDSQTGTVVTTTSVPADIDTGSFALSIVPAGEDLIVITATVPPIFTFDLNGFTDTFTTNLSSSSIVSTNGRTLTVGTNAANGWTAWVKSTYAGLNSSAASSSIATAGALGSGPSDLDSLTGYVLDADVTTQGGGAGTMTIDTEYDGADATQGGTLATTFQPLASANGTTDGDVLTIYERAKVVATQAAASDYTDTLTIIAAGLF